MQTIKNLVTQTAKRKGIEQQIQSAEVIEHAKKVLAEIFGPEALTLLNPLYVKNRTITIAANSPSVAQELKLKEEKIINGLNKAMGGGDIERIRYLL